VVVVVVVEVMLISVVDMGEECRSEWKISKISRNSRFLRFFAESLDQCRDLWYDDRIPIGDGPKGKNVNVTGGRRADPRKSIPGRRAIIGPPRSGRRDPAR
jgi:hypothetical protein